MSRVEYSPLYYELGFEDEWGLRPDFPTFITDTFWPQILGEIGVLGLLAYLVFVAAIGLSLWRAARAFSDPLLACFCLGTLMVFGHALVETLASSMFHSPPRVYLLFGAVGMCLSLLRSARQTDQPEPRGDLALDGAGG
jgi:O-antigen ligase